MRTPKTSTAKAQHTRQRIIEAAIRIIASRGIEKATTREISKEAEVANGLVTRYLKSQDELFATVTQFIAAVAYNEIEAAPEALTAQEKILWMCEKNIDFFLNHPDYAKCFLLFYYYASIDAFIRSRNAAFDKRAISRLETYLRQTISTEEELGHATATIHGQIVSAVYRYYTVPQALSKEEYRLDFLNRCRWLIRHIGITS